MIGLPALAGILGMAGVVCAAAAVFLSGPPLLVRGARSLSVGSVAVGAAGLLQELVQSGFQFEPTRGGGQGSLFATGGMLLLIFAAARSAENKRLRLQRERLAKEREERSSGAVDQE